MVLRVSVTSCTTAYLRLHLENSQLRDMICTAGPVEYQLPVPGTVHLVRGTWYHKHQVVSPHSVNTYA